MAVSEAIYGITTSYVSSSAYYGFVPQNNHHHQPGVNYGSNSWDVNVNMKQARNGNSQHGGAMETDDDSHDVDLVNNYCVIPEALRGINPAVYHSNYLDGHNNTVPGFVVGALDRQSCQDAGRRRNRKRNNDGELMLVEPDQLKRLRKGSGNSGTYHGRGFAKDGGLAKVCYKSSRLCINRRKYLIEDEDEEEKREEEEEEELATVESCCWAAGNHSTLVNDDDEDKDKDFSLNGNSKLRRNLVSDLDYEEMLLKTHGCSAYHHQRFQSEYGIAESEF